MPTKKQLENTIKKLQDERDSLKIAVTRARSELKATKKYQDRLESIKRGT